MMNSAPLLPYVRSVPIADVHLESAPFVKSVWCGLSVSPTSVGHVANPEGQRPDLWKKQ
jgi:hypothetical protein